jgi:hypothetical protein
MPTTSRGDDDDGQRRCLRAEFSRRGRPHTAKFFERYRERVEALYASLR